MAASTGHGSWLPLRFVIPRPPLSYSTLVRFTSLLYHKGCPIIRTAPD
uniref:Uncharacterized protein n=1 Tax=Myoviridae sp. ctRPH1 TaxID=2826650 RepID=A0A8S5MAK0_9CAUD|nr:MAG TPA: hypothetical protein [Myoviridae sp. ctRPH1]